MFQRFQKEEIDKIQTSYKTNELYIAVKASCSQLSSTLHDLLPSTEEVFFEILRILDDLKEKPKQYLEEEVPNLWNTLLTEYRRDNTNIKLEEHQALATIVEGCAAAVLSVSSHSCYSVIAKNAMMQNLADKDNEKFVTTLMPIFVEMERHRDKLGGFIDDYMSSDTFLSDEIDLMLHPKPTKERKPRAKKLQQPYTLTYKLNDTETRNKKIQLFGKCLEVIGWLENPRTVDLIDFFSGEIRDCNLKWKGSQSALYRLVKELLEQPYIKDVPNVSARAIVLNQFHKNLDEGKITDDARLKIDMLVWLLNPNSPKAFPSSNQRYGYQQEDFNIDNIIHAYEADLTIKNR